MPSAQTQTTVYGADGNPITVARASAPPVSVYDAHGNPLSSPTSITSQFAVPPVPVTLTKMGAGKHGRADTPTSDHGFLHGLASQLGVAPEQIHETAAQFNPAEQGRRAIDAVRAGDYSGAFAHGTQALLGPLGGLVVPAAQHLLSDPYEEALAAKRAADEGSASRAIGHGAAALLPVFGHQAADIGEEFGTNTPHAAGRAAGLIAPFVVPPLTSAALRATDLAPTPVSHLLREGAKPPLLDESGNITGPASTGARAIVREGIVARSLPKLYSAVYKARAGVGQQIGATLGLSDAARATHIDATPLIDTPIAEAQKALAAIGNKGAISRLDAMREGLYDAFTQAGVSPSAATPADVWTVRQLIDRNINWNGREGVEVTAQEVSKQIRRGMARAIGDAVPESNDLMQRYAGLSDAFDDVRARIQSKPRTLQQHLADPLNLLVGGGIYSAWHHDPLVAAGLLGARAGAESTPAMTGLAQVMRAGASPAAGPVGTLAGVSAGVAAEATPSPVLTPAPAHTPPRAKGVRPKGVPPNLQTPPQAGQTDFGPAENGDYLENTKPSLVLPARFKTALSATMASPRKIGATDVAPGGPVEQDDWQGRYLSQPDTVHGLGANTALVSRSAGAHWTETLYHELGHAIYEKDLTKQERTAVGKYFDDFAHERVNWGPQTEAAFNGPGQRKVGEFFPELVSMYVSRPSVLKQEAPEGYALVKRIFGGKEYIRK